MGGRTWLDVLFWFFPLISFSEIPATSAHMSYYKCSSLFGVFQSQSFSISSVMVYQLYREMHIIFFIPLFDWRILVQSETRRDAMLLPSTNGFYQRTLVLGTGYELVAMMGAGAEPERVVEATLQLSSLPNRIMESHYLWFSCLDFPPWHIFLYLFLQKLNLVNSQFS